MKDGRVKLAPSPAVLSLLCKASISADTAEHEIKMFVISYVK